MSQCKFTHSAKRDLEKISEYSLKKWEKIQTEKYIAELASKSLALSANPNIGTDCCHIAKNLLSFPVQKHIFYYQKIKNGIIIVRILHKHMCPRRHSIIG